MLISYIIIGLLILADYGLKMLFSSLYQPGQVETILPNILKFGHYQNTGASFGMLEGEQFLFFLITIFALVFFGYLFSKSDFKTKKVYTIATIFLIAGTLGNAIDRVMYGYVIDYIQIPFLPFVGNTYFNLADALLNFGVALLVIDIVILDEIRKRKEKSTHNETNQD